MVKDKQIKNKIGYCENKYLKGLEHLSGGHYVYIRKVNNDGTCCVNVITSLEDKFGNFDNKKIKQVKKGNTYAIPKYDSNLSKWSGINKKPIDNVEISNILSIGTKKIKRRHNFYIGKYMK